MIKIHPYLNFNGNTEEAFNFYKSVFGKEFSILQRFKDIPDSEKMPTAIHEKIMHVSLPITETLTLMGTDAVEGMGEKLIEGNNISLSIDTSSKEEANELFSLLSKDGEIKMALSDTFWGAYFGMCKDRFGIIWMVNHDYK